MSAVTLKQLTHSEITSLLFLCSPVSHHTIMHVSAAVYSRWLQRRLTPLDSIFLCMAAHHLVWLHTASYPGSFLLVCTRTNPSSRLACLGHRSTLASAARMMVHVSWVDPYTQCSAAPLIFCSKALFAASDSSRFLFELLANRLQLYIYIYICRQLASWIWTTGGCSCSHISQSTRVYMGRCVFVVGWGLDYLWSATNMCHVELWVSITYIMAS